MIKVIYHNRTELLLNPPSILEWLSNNAPQDIIESYLDRERKCQQKIANLRKEMRNTNNRYEKCRKKMKALERIIGAKKDGAK